jgi:hypothetical protein
VINEVVQLLSKFAVDPANGLNAAVSIIPRANVDPLLPDYPAPPVVPVLDDVTSPGVAANLDPEKVPCFMMWGDSQVQVEYRGYKTAREVVIAGAFVTAEDADPIFSERTCGYILRGGVISFQRFNSQSVSRSFRSLNGVKILEIKSVVEQRVTAAVGRRKMWGFLDIRVIALEDLT